VCAAWVSAAAAADSSVSVNSTLLQQGLALAALTDFPVPEEAVPSVALAKEVVAMRTAFAAGNNKQAGDVGAGIISKFSVRVVCV
jgi:hypothetical protein